MHRRTTAGAPFFSGTKVARWCVGPIPGARAHLEAQGQGSRYTPLRAVAASMPPRMGLQPPRHMVAVAASVLRRCAIALCYGAML